MPLYKSCQYYWQLFLCTVVGNGMVNEIDWFIYYLYIHKNGYGFLKAFAQRLLLIYNSFKTPYACPAWFCYN
jgi:hypothetical protein